MIDQHDNHDQVVGQIADDFLSRYRSGESLSIDDWAAAYPDIATELRDFLSTVVTMEDAAKQGGDWSHAFETDPVYPRHLRQLGDFRLRHEVGRGGMGVVYDAMQVSLDRRVALKALPFASMLDRQQLARFKTEAQAAARLHHTNIVPIYAVGCECGVHYYAMQYIEGQTLEAFPDNRTFKNNRQYCRQQLNSDSSDNE